MDEATTGDRTLTDEEILTVAPGATTVSERPMPDGDDEDSKDSDGTDSKDTDGTDSKDADGTDAAS